MAGVRPRWLSNRHTMKADLMWEFCLDKEVGEGREKRKNVDEEEGEARTSLHLQMGVGNQEWAELDF